MTIRIETCGPQEAATAARVLSLFLPCRAEGREVVACDDPPQHVTHHLYDGPRNGSRHVLVPVQNVKIDRAILASDYHLDDVIYGKWCGKAFRVGRIATHCYLLLDDFPAVLFDYSRLIHNVFRGLETHGQGRNGCGEREVQEGCENATADGRYENPPGRPAAVQGRPANDPGDG